MSDPNVDPTIDEGNSIAEGMLITSIIVSVIAFIGFVIGIIAMVKTSHGKYKLMPWWAHLIFTLFAAPVELVLGSIEIHRMGQHTIPSHDMNIHSTPDYASDM